MSRLLFEELRMNAAAGHRCAALALTALVALAATASPGADSSPQNNVARTAIAFDVASVRPNTTGERVITVNTYPGGRFVATNISLRSLVRLAYGLQDHEIIGGPSWMNESPFDVEARAGTELPEMNGPFSAGGLLPRMLQSLLADRFRLAAHMEMRDMPVLHLVVARDDRRLGENVKRSFSGLSRRAGTHTGRRDAGFRRTATR